MKKFLAVFLSAVMIFCSFPFTSFAASKVKAPAAPKSLSATSTVSTISLKWKSVKKVSGYKIYRYNTKNKKSSAVASTKKTNYKISKLTAGTTYVYYVKAYVNKGKKKLYSKASSKVTVSTLPSKVSGFKVKSADFTSVALTWKKVKNATSYKIQYSTDKKFKKAVKSVTTSSTGKTVGSLTENKVYYFRIYACRKVNKKTYNSAASSVISAKTYVAAKISAVNESKKYQTVEGFGASGAWWAQKVGGWDNADDYLKLLYSKTDGIGLNIYRYNLGAGTDHDDKIDHGKSAQSFIDSVEGTKNEYGYWQAGYKINYDWSKDANAQKSLALAKKYAGNNLKVVLFANSPPVEFTQNSKGYCSYHKESENYKTNLARENFSIFSDYIAACADHFIEQGYNVVDVSPVNEPQFDWSCNENGYMSQEGSYYLPKTLKSLYSNMVTKAKTKPYKISMFESASAEGADSTFSNYLTNIMSDSNNKNYFDSVSIHSYWSDKKLKQDCYNFMKNQFPNLTVACTEYCQMTNDENTGVFNIQSTLNGFAYNGTTIDFGLQMARVINEDLTVLNATQWNWWTAVSGGYYPDGLIYYNGPVMTEDQVWDSSSKDLFTSKRLWCLGNYSKYIQSGAKRVQVTETQKNLLSSAYKNPDGSLVIVYINQQNRNMSVNVNAPGYKNYKTYVTSSSKDLQLSQQGTYSIKNNVSIPAKSVVTLKLTK